jgi:CheY-like chemotaxis protein
MLGLGVETPSLWSHLMSAVGSSVASDQGASPKRLLVVDDEILVGMMAAEELDELGYAVLGPASSVREALRLAATGRIDGALLDWKLRGEPCVPVAELLAARGIPFIFLTGYDEIPDPRFHGTVVLRKPFSIHQLKHAVVEMLAGANGEFP